MSESVKYRKPEGFRELGARVPRLVNPRWVMLALRDNARAVDAGTFYPWKPAELDRRAAAIIELHIVRKQGRR